MSGPSSSTAISTSASASASASAYDWLLAGPSDVPRQRRLYQGLREAILAGRLKPGTRLPASRVMAAELGVARNTVLHAYEQLVAEGGLVADRSGTRVAALPSLVAPQTADAAVRPPPLSLRAQAALAASRRERGDDALPFAPGVPDVAGFPFRAWRACLDRAWRDARPRQLGYAMHGGEPSLRAALAEYLGTARGVAVGAEQVVITAGTQAALDLCARLLADQGDTVWVENPGYPAARAAFSLAGLTLHPVAVDGEGLAPDSDDWSRHRPRLIFATPSHQYPTGVVLSLRRRLELVEGAHAAGAWIIEDDYDSEFRRGGPALPAMYGLRPDLAVIYAGTFSKTLFPGLRVGYLVVPRALSAAFSEAAAHAQRPGHGVEQAALADFIRRGHYTAHLRRMRQRYEARQRALRAALVRHPGPETRVSGGEAGLHLTLWLPDTLSDVAVCQAAQAQGLSPRPLSDYAMAPARCNGILLGYGNLEEVQIDEAVRRLRLAMRLAAG